MNSNQQKVEAHFPDINTFLCPEEIVSLSTADRNYRKALVDTQLAYNIEYANKLHEYQNIYKPQNIIPIKSDFSQFMTHMKKWKKKNGYNFSIVFQRRKKGYIKFNEKVRLFIKNSLNATTDEEKMKYSLDRICDEIGIRLILLFDRNDTHESVSMCYKVLNEVNFFFTVKKGYIPINAEPLIDLGFNSQKYPNVIVPTDEEARLPEGLDVKVKDYYKTPKKHAYQSLHIAYSSSLYGLPFEIQIRTMATHTRVEYETASHYYHDKDRYPERIELDRKNIHIYGYQYINNNGIEDVEDFIGLEKSVDPFNILY